MPEAVCEDPRVLAPPVSFDYRDDALDEDFFSCSDFAFSAWILAIICAF